MTTTSLIPTQTGLHTVTLHAEAIHNNRQIGVAVSCGALFQIANGKAVMMQPAAGMSVMDAALGMEKKLMAIGGVKFV